MRLASDASFVPSPQSIKPDVLKMAGPVIQSEKLSFESS